MDCKEFERLIPDFIQNKLDFLTLSRFNKHRKMCEECKEELEIRFLVSEGIQRLEEGDVFDLQRELNLHLSEAEKRIRRHDRWLLIGEMLEIFAIILLVGAVVWIIL